MIAKLSKASFSEFPLYWLHTLLSYPKKLNWKMASDSQEQMTIHLVSKIPPLKYVRWYYIERYKYRCQRHLCHKGTHLKVWQLLCYRYRIWERDHEVTATERITMDQKAVIFRKTFKILTVECVSYEIWNNSYRSKNMWIFWPSDTLEWITLRGSSYMFI